MTLVQVPLIAEDTIMDNAGDIRQLVAKVPRQNCGRYVLVQFVNQIPAEVGRVNDEYEAQQICLAHNLFRDESQGMMVYEDLTLGGEFFS